MAESPEVSPHLLALFVAAPWLADRVTDLGCCVIAQGRRDAKGYVRVPGQPGGKPWQRAHRAVWTEAFGDPGEMDVDHVCRVRACVRLDHLRLLTHSENARRGALSGWAKEAGSPCCAAVAEALEAPAKTTKGRATQERLRHQREHPEEYRLPAVASRWRAAYAECDRESDFVLALADPALRVAQTLPEAEGKWFLGEVVRFALDELDAQERGGHG